MIKAKCNNKKITKKEKKKKKIEYKCNRNEVSNDPLLALLPSHTNPPYFPFMNLSATLG